MQKDVPMNVKEFLTERIVPFEVLTHAPTETAIQMAKELNVPACSVAKTVMLELDKGFRYAVAVLPATQTLDLKQVGRMLSGSLVEILPEDKLHEHCHDCEVGAIPPFGTMYGMMTLADDSLTQCDEITFEGNLHTESIRMKWEDFENLEHPLIGKFANADSAQ